MPPAPRRRLARSRLPGGLVAALTLAAAIAASACSSSAGPPKDLHIGLVITSPADGARVTEPFRLSIQVSGFTLHAANGDRSGKTGHLVFFIDATPPPAGAAIAKKAPGVFRTPKASVTVNKLTSGHHVITVVAADGKNHRLTDAEAVLHLDVTAPPGGVATTIPQASLPGAP